MKLFIDDIRNPPDDSWHICRDVNSAIRALDMFWPEITDVNLDHDISHQVVVNGMSRPYPCTETFEAVARYIVRLHLYQYLAFKHEGATPLWNPKINIHTSNPVGAQKMKELFSEIGIEPVIQIAKGANRLETIL